MQTDCPNGCGEQVAVTKFVVDSGEVEIRATAPCVCEAEKTEETTENGSEGSTD